MSDNRKIRIVFGVNDFLVGGMQRQLSEQLRFFDRERFEFILITLFEFPGARDMYALLPEGLEVHRFAFTGGLDLASWRKLYRLLAGLQPDIVVSSLFFSNFVFRILKPFLGYRSIAREHNTYIHKPPWQRIADRLLAPVSSRIVAVSGSVATFTARQEHIEASKFVVIHNGIDVQSAEDELATLPSRETLRETLGFSGSERILLNIARLMSQKNHELLIDGFSLLAKELPDLRLAIVGDGPSRGALEQRADAHGLGTSVRFFGHRDDVAAFYKASDLFVSTSTIEGFSNSYLEALASELPLVATKTAGTDELIEEGKNGLFIADATPDCVAETIRTALTKPELKDQARATVRKFDIRTTVGKYESLFLDNAVHF